MIKDNIVYIAIGIGVAVLLAVVAIFASRKKPVFKKKGQLLLLNEQRFLIALLQAMPSDMILSFKVRLLDIVSSFDKNSGKNLDEELADFSVDFVLVDRNTCDVRLCIEMDHESKSASERLNKNTMISRSLRRAGIAHVRMPLVRYYDPTRIRQVIRETMSAHANTVQQPIK